MQALGCEGISKSQVSRICSELDAVVDAFLSRPLDGGPYPYLWLDALTVLIWQPYACLLVNEAAYASNCLTGMKEAG